MGKWNRGKSKGVRGLRAGIAVMAAVCLLAESAGCGAAEEGTAEAAAAQYQNHLDISLAYWQIDSETSLAHAFVPRSPAFLSHT